MDIPPSMKDELAAWNNGAGIDLESWVGCEGRFALAVGYAAIFWPEFEEFDGYILRKGFSEKSLRGFEGQKGSSRRSTEWVMNHSGEGAGDAPPSTTAQSFSEIGKDAPAACAPQIAAVLALYSHETDAVAVRSYENLSRDSGTGWNNWTWARLHALHGHSKVFLYYFDVSPPDSTVGAYHGAETPYVFGRPSAPLA
jgi:Carboxylesterase family